MTDGGSVDFERAETGRRARSLAADIEEETGPVAARAAALRTVGWRELSRMRRRAG